MICEKAMQQKDANVHRVDDFLLELTSPTPLFLGQKPDNTMIEKRNEDTFSKLKTNYNDVNYFTPTHDHVCVCTFV